MGLHQKAQNVTTDHEQTRLNKEDWQTFFAMIENLIEPTERLKKAARKYKKITLDNEIDLLDQK